MCGVFFYPAKLSINKNHFKELLLHRGPDYQEIIKNNDIIIGHNLLSIRGELNDSKQPLKINNDYIISFNGEIYNTINIINKFSIKKSSNDTKIILELIQKVGKDFINYIEGMYAIILYDIRKEETTIYRDHSGQKNIYYYKSKYGIVLSSELLPITKIKNFNNEIDYNYLNQSMIIGHPCSEKTLFKNVKKIKPGQIITFDKVGDIIFDSISKKKLTNNLSNLNIYESIDETVKTHTFSKDKIGINLSSGLDSNIVLYHSLKHKSNVEAFSTFFENVDKRYNNDFFGAKKIANHYGIKFNQTNITKENYEKMFSKSFSNIEEINRNLGNPTYLLNYNNQKKEKFRVILSGDGGDEIFVGYDWYFKGRFREKFLKIISFFGKKLNFYIYLYNYLSQFNRYNSFFHKNFFYSNNLKNKFNYKEINLSIHKYIQNNFTDKVYNFNYFKLILDQYLWLPNEILLRADKLGMSQSLEIRNPFCDQNLRKKLIDELTMNDFKTPNNKNKIRNIYRSKLPNDALMKSKYGWTSPKEWVNSPTIRMEILDNIPSFKSDYFDWFEIKKEIETNKDIMNNRSIYPLISLIFLIKKFRVSI